ncbi:hypothetical protein MITS9509_03312 [Synechococcus sp. MIT S9509]|nr:hypothetical protein MITS9504_03312 [Synechococcus sp. MIT S9504]KZR88488.1 hypothetical protein MITS9509_03312 [Synechococcus sp. MIT S9509]
MATFKKNARCTDGNDLAIQPSILKTDQPTTFIKNKSSIHFKCCKKPNFDLIAVIKTNRDNFNSDFGKDLATINVIYRSTGQLIQFKLQRFVRV